MSAPAEYDYVVVGGRVAGASTAMLLARAGARVLLLERTAYGSDTVSTHALMRAGVLQLHRWGLLDRVIDAGTPPVRRTVFHYADDDSVQISIRRSPGVPALYAPRRQVLDTVLVDAARAAGVEVRHGTTVIGLMTHGGRVCGVVARDAAGRELHARSRVTIGADGIRSTVASAVAAPYEAFGADGGALMYGYYKDFPAEGYEWAYGPGAAAGLIPTNDALTCVFVATTPARLRDVRRREGSEATFERLFGVAAPAHAGRLRAARRVGRLHGWSGVPAHVRRSWGPGWALVGDAGYFVDPTTTHGMTDAMRDAELLADALAGTAEGTMSEPTALAAYQQQRDNLSAQLFGVSNRIAAYDWDLAGLRRLLREVSSAMSDEVALLQGRPVGAEEAGLPRFLEADMPAARG